MDTWVEIKKLLCIIPFTVLMNINTLYSEKRPDIDPMLLWKSFFGTQSKSDLRNLVLTPECICVILLYCLVQGNRISLYFEKGNCSYFVRIKDKKDWLIQQHIYFLLNAILYTILYIWVKVWMEFRLAYKINLDIGILNQISFIFLYLLPVILTSGILTNWIATAKGTAVSIVVVFIILMVGQFLAVMMFDYSGNWVLNPFCYNYEMLSHKIAVFGKILVNFGYAFIICRIEYRYFENIDIC